MRGAMTIDRRPLKAGTEGVSCLAAALALALCGAPAYAEDASRPDLIRHCARVIDDDQVRGYDPSLATSTIAAFRARFPNAKAAPDPSEFQTAAYRCMDGKALACFSGANLPCSKINASRDNAGASAACRDRSDGEMVSASEAGHDAAYAFTCKGGKAVVSGTTWTLDRRGFAKEVWTPLPDPAP